MKNEDSRTMRTLGVLLSILILFFPYWGTAKNTLEEMNVKGKVKTMMSTEYQIGDDNTESTRKVTLVFNAQGNKISEKITDEKGAWIFQNKLSYSPQGLLISDLSSNKVTFQMDVTKKYEYNAQKQLAKIKVYEYRNAVINTIVYTYNAKGYLVKMTNTNARKELQDNIAYRYNDAGLLIEEQTLDEKSQLVSALKYDYDEFGRVITKSEYDKDFLNFKSTYIYDEHNNVIFESSNYTSGTVTEIDYTYTYDKKGNWILLREQMNGKTYAVTSRVINYD